MVVFTIEEGSNDAETYRQNQRLKTNVSCQVLGLALQQTEDHVVGNERRSNEESIRTALQSQAKVKPKAKGNVAQTGEGEEAAASAAAAKAKPKPKPKPKPTANPKGSSKGKDDGSGASAKPDSKGKGTGKGDAKAKAKPRAGAQSVPCIFWPKELATEGMIVHSIMIPRQRQRHLQLRQRVQQHHIQRVELQGGQQVRVQRPRPQSPRSLRRRCQRHRRPEFDQTRAGRRPPSIIGSSM